MPTTPPPSDDRNRSPSDSARHAATNELTQPYKQAEAVEAPPLQGDASTGTNELSAADTPTASYSAEEGLPSSAQAALPEIAGYQVLRRVRAAAWERCLKRGIWYWTGRWPLKCRCHT